MMLIFEYLFWLIEFLIPKLLNQLGVHNPRWWIFIPMRLNGCFLIWISKKA